MKYSGCKTLVISAIALIMPTFSYGQVPVDDDGNVIGSPATGAAIESLAEPGRVGEDGIPLLSAGELQELVGPVALYPDDLLAVVLPAAAYPLQVAAAARFLEDLELDPTLQPDPDWDDSIVALVNYPEVVELMNNDLDWTYRLGEAVIAQQNDVITAVESFRDRAYAAGNLKSDSYQHVAHNDGVIEIDPVSEDVIYVPYYEPARMLVYQRRPSYYYYPRPCPVYYYPYSAGHYFDRGYFWGVTTAFSIGWYSDSLNVYHHSYRGHPFFGRHYRDNWWYRRPSISVYNTTYVNNNNVYVNRNSNGDRWRARVDRREYVLREGYTRTTDRSSRNRATTRRNEPVAVRQRDSLPVTRSRSNAVQQSRTERSAEAARQREEIRTAFRSRDRDVSQTNTRNRSDADRRQTTTRDRVARTESRSESRRQTQQIPARQERPARVTESNRQRDVQSSQQRAPAQVQPRRPETRQVQPRRAEPRQVTPRRTEPRQAQPTRRAEPRQVQQPKRAEPRQVQPQRAETQRAQPTRRSEPATRRESSSRQSGSSERKERSSRSDRRSKTRKR